MITFKNEAVKALDRALQRALGSTAAFARVDTGAAVVSARGDVWRREAVQPSGLRMTKGPDRTLARVDKLRKSTKQAAVSFDFDDPMFEELVAPAWLLTPFPAADFEVELGASQLADALVSVLSVAGSDPAQPHLNGAEMLVEDGRVTFRASNGHSAAVRSVPCTTKHGTGAIWVRRDTLSAWKHGIRKSRVTLRGHLVWDVPPNSTLAEVARAARSTRLVELEVRDGLVRSLEPAAPQRPLVVPAPTAPPSAGHYDAKLLAAALGVGAGTCRIYESNGALFVEGVDRLAVVARVGGRS